jgi:predicted PurR-regulated permease PerM
MGLSDSQKWLVLVFAAVVGALLYYLAPILMPFAIAAFLAYLGDPLVDRLETYRLNNVQLNRTWSVVVVFFGIIVFATALLLIIIPTLEYQVSEFIEKLPSYLNWFNKSVIPGLQKYLGKGVRPLKTDQLLAMTRSYWQGDETQGETLLQSVSHSGAVIVGWVMNLLLIPVITFYLLRDWDRLMRSIHDLFPRRYADTVSKLAVEVDEVLGAFVRGQFYVMLAMGVIYSLGLLSIGLDLALLIGMTAGLISFVPYMGVIVGIGLAFVAALLQFQDAVHFVSVLTVFGIGHAIEGMLLTPWLVGNKIGLHPVAVIFAVLAGGQLFGFLGILLALPLASVIMVLLRHIHERYTVSGFYSHHSHS